MKIRTKIPLILGSFCLMLAFLNCAKNSDSDTSDPTPNAPSGAVGCLAQLGTNNDWSNESEVPIDGFSGNMMEPRISHDQIVIFFNDKPSSDDQMNIHYAIKQSSGRYTYVGTLPGTVDNSSLDGVPAVDANGKFYFISTRTYATNQQTIYSGQVAVVGSGLVVNSVTPADNAIKRGGAAQLDMDLDISWDGTKAVVSRAVFSNKAYPDESYLEMFNVSGGQLSTMSDGKTVMSKLNLNGCRIYAPSLSNDGKELFYTMLEINGDGSTKFAVAVAKRSDASAAFEAGAKIGTIAGEAVEGPSISYDDGGKTLFYHRFDSASGKFKIYKVTRP